jgi:predicted MFS family arabinose efflux permease
VAGDIGSGALSRRYVTRRSPTSWWRLLVKAVATLITSVDRVILTRVLPALQDEFGLSYTTAGFLNSLNFIGITIGTTALGVAATIPASVAGSVIDNFGFAINYVVLAIPCLIALAFVRKTRVTGGEATQE